MNKPKFSLFPQFVYQNITDITPGFFSKLNIRFAMLDIDNTIATYSGMPSGSVISWIERIRGSGVAMYLVSNSKRGHRVKAIAQALELGYITRARKPSPAGLHRVMKEAGYTPDVSCLIGDQIITDILAANRAGVTSVIVYPIHFSNPFFALRYCLELPFRYAGKRNNQGIL